MQQQYFESDAKQCAAVIIQRSVRMAPPQKWEPLFCRETWAETITNIQPFPAETLAYRWQPEAAEVSGSLSRRQEFYTVSSVVYHDISNDRRWWSCEGYALLYAPIISGCGKLITDAMNQMTSRIRAPLASLFTYNWLIIPSIILMHNVD